mmetsp:Transcript_19869/g.41682  ORF Transcript_19869/g.41682 Transcript_19869/m.41682 type:complete len:112 (-) Transcript_19869:402-737(-)
MNLYVRFITADESISFTHDHVQHRETNNEFWTRIPIYNGVKMQSWSCGNFLHRFMRDDQDSSYELATTNAHVRENSVDFFDTSARRSGSKTPNCFCIACSRKTASFANLLR